MTIARKSLDEVRAGLTAGFENRLLDAALQTLDDVDNPLRFNSFAGAIRELNRHVLTRLAPDDHVKQCVWYSDETDKPGQVTRRQRAAYAVHGGLTPEYVRDDLHLDVDQMNRHLRDATDTLNKYTHVGEDTFDLDPADVGRMSQQVIDALGALFKKTDDCRLRVSRALEAHVEREVIDEALAETIIEIDELATHHFIDEIYTAEVHIENISYDSIHLLARGTISVELQYGSNSDLKADMGAIIPMSFPFECTLEGNAEEPGEFHARASQFRVDTSEWRGKFEPGDDEI